MDLSQSGLQMKTRMPENCATHGEERTTRMLLSIFVSGTGTHTGTISRLSLLGACLNPPALLVVRSFPGSNIYSLTFNAAADSRIRHEVTEL